MLTHVVFPVLIWISGVMVKSLYSASPYSLRMFLFTLFYSNESLQFSLPFQELATDEASV